MKSTERLQHLIYLLQSGRKLTADDLADEFGVTRRTIFRDLRRLSDLNIPVTHDHNSGYGIMSTSEISPIMFTERELSTVIIGLSFARSQINTQLRDDAAKVSRKISASLPSHLRDMMSTLEKKTIVDPFIQKDSVQTSGGNWFVISKGLTLGRPIEFFYESRNGSRQQRKADPLLLVYYYDHWNMVGFCHDRKDLRNFILERMDEVTTSNHKTEVKSETDNNIDDLLFRLDDPFDVRISISNSFKDEFIKHLPVMSFQQQKVDSDITEITFKFDNYDFLNRWMLQFADALQVHAPEKLISLRRDTLKKMLNS